MELLQIEGVTGVGIGHKPDGGEVITIYIVQDSAALRRRLPTSLEDVPTEVRLSGEIAAQR
ncbi:MAG: hypothetical protein V3T81_02235 [Thermoanaerobaculia bacterium]